VALLLFTLSLLACRQQTGRPSPVTGPTPRGYEAGNGGNVVVCRDGEGVIESVELLDYYEGRELSSKLHPALGPNSLTQIEKARYALQRLRRLDGARADGYQASAEKFFAEAAFVKNQILPDTKDYGYVPLPANCKIEQIAVQHTVVDGKRYHINQDLWNLLTADHQAGLILHEVIYHDALGQGHKPRSIPASSTRS
jgi:hypothetical protein